jgi:hypothetical protein
MKHLKFYGGGGKYLAPSFCDEKCERCKWRYQCYTTRETWLDVVANAEELEYYMVTGNLEEQGIRLMLCPHCQQIFPLKDEQIAQNTKFRCPACHRFNYGSCEATHGVLVGMVYERESDD